MKCTDDEMRVRLRKLRGIHPAEIGARAGETAAMIEEILKLRAENRPCRNLLAFMFKNTGDNADWPIEIKVAGDVSATLCDLLNEADAAMGINPKTV